MKNMYFNLNQLASKTDGEPTVNRQSRLMLRQGKRSENGEKSSTCLRSASDALSFRSRYLRYAAMIFCVLVMSVGQAWGTDFDVTLNQIRVFPTRAALVTLSNDANCTASSGFLQIANSTTGTFTIASTVSSTYKIKSIAFTVNRNVTGFTCTSGGTLSGSNKSWTFSPTSGTPVGSASFSLNNTSGGGAQITFVVTMTTAETITVEEIDTFTFSTPNYSFTSSAATSQILITNPTGGNGAASSSMINFGKSSSKTYKLNVAAKTGYNLKFISFYFYDCSSDPKGSSDPTTYTKSTYTWIPSSTETSVEFSFDTENTQNIKIYRIYVGYVAAAAGPGWGIAGTMNSWTAASNEMTGSGTVSTTINLSANSQYEFKVVDTSTDTWYGNGGTIKGGITDWEFTTGGGNTYLRTSCAGDYTFTFNTSTKNLSITYPNSNKVYFAKGGASWSNIYAYCYNDNDWNIGWPGIEITSNTEDNCGTEYYAYTNGYTYIIFNNGSGGDGNQTGDITVAGYSGKHAVGDTATKWVAYPTYTVTYNANGDGAGNATGTTGSVPTDGSSPYACGSTVTVLGNKGSLAKTGYAFDGWNTAPGGGGTSYAADATFTISANTTLYAKWAIQSYNLTWNLGGGTTTSAGTGIASGVSANTTSSVVYGTSLTAPTVTKTGYNFNAWSPSVASTMPAAATTYTATWTAKTTTITIDDNDENHGSTTPGTVTATWGSALPSFTAASGASGYGLKGYYTAATSGDKIVNADGTLVRNTDYATDESTPKWKYETSTLTLYPQYELTCRDTVFSVAGSIGSAAVKTATATVNWGTSLVLGNNAGRITIKPNSGKFKNGDVIYLAGKTGSADKNFGVKIYAPDGTTNAGQPHTDGNTSSTSVSGTITLAADADSLFLARYDGTGTTLTQCIISRVADCPVAPSNAEITPSNGWIYVPGEEITLTASAETTNASTTYTWYRGATIEAAKAAGVIQEEKTAAAGGTTYTIAECEAADAYRYWVEISNGTGYETSTSYDIKIYTFFLYDNTPSKIDDYTFSTIDRVNNKISVTIPLSNINYTYQFKVSDGLGTWYGHDDATITGSHAYWDGLNSTGANVGLTSSFADDYTIDYYYNSNNVVVTYPVHNQAEDVTVYFDNRLTEMENMYIRIGHDANSKASSAFTLVPGTANLYVGTTTSFNDFHAWSIADNTGWTGSNTIYQPWNDGGVNKPNDSYAITKQTNYQRYVVDETISIIPTSVNNTEYGCTYWNVDKVSGMKRDRVTITAPVNGTVTVNYTSEEDVASSFSATTVDMYQDLAHTVRLTSITAVPNTGYDAGAITINGGAYSANYVVTGATTIAASFTPQTYTISYKDQGNVTYTGSNLASLPASHTYGVATALVAGVKTGYTFVGWFTDAECTVSAGMSIGTTAITANTTLYAKWTEDVAPCPTGGDIFTLEMTYSGGSAVKVAANSTLAMTATHGTATGGTVTFGNQNGFSNDKMQIKKPGIAYINGDDAYIKIDLSCPLKTGDVLTFTSDEDKQISFTQEASRATSPATSSKKWTVPSTFNNVSTIYIWRASSSSVNLHTINIVRPVTVTFDKNGGSSVSPTSATYDGSSSSVLATPVRADYHFDGWNTKSDGSGDDLGLPGETYYLDDVTTSTTTIYAQWSAKSCASGTIYQFTLNTGLTNDNFPKTTEVYVKTSDYLATMTGGYLKAYNSGSDKLKITDNKYICINNSSSYLLVQLDCPLRAGDQIKSTVKSQALYITKGSDSRASTYSLPVADNNLQTIPAAWAGATEIKIWAGSSNGGKIQDFQIIRAASTYKVTYDDNDATSGDAPEDNTDYDYNAEVTVASNSGTLAMTNYSTLAYWNTKEDGSGTDYAIGSGTFNITDNTTLYAKWTQAVTFDANTANHGSAGGSATAVWNATALTGITHATPASGYKLLGYYTTASGDGVKVLNSDGTFAGSNVTNYITSGKWSRTDEAPTLYARYESSGALIWNLGVNTNATSLTTSSKESSFTQIAVANMGDATLSGSTYTKSAKSSLTGKISSPATKSDYVYVTFTVADGYKFTPSNISVKVQPVGENEHKNVELLLTDESSHSLASASATKCDGTTSGKTTTVSLAGNSTFFIGNVTLKIYVYDFSGSATGTYRLGTPIQIDGEVEELCATMPSYTSMSYTTTTFAPNASALGSPITIVGGENIDTYQWKYNTTNDRTSGTECGSNEASLVPLTNAEAATDGTRYYWCEMTNTECDITIKSPAVAITVVAAKSNATVSWTGTTASANYGGGGYTVTATVSTAEWDGTLTEDMLTAMDGVVLSNIKVTNDGKTISANFGVTEGANAEATNVAFYLNHPATTGYNAIDETYNTTTLVTSCISTGGGDGSSYDVRVRKNTTTILQGKSTVYGWDTPTKGFVTQSTGGSVTSTKSGYDDEPVFDSISKGNAKAYWVKSYVANVKKIRVYGQVGDDDLTATGVYHVGSFVAGGSSTAVAYSVVYEDEVDALKKGNHWFEITLDEAISTNDIIYFTVNKNFKIMGVRLTTVGAGGATLETALSAWSPAIVTRKEVNEDAASFVETVTKTGANANTMGAITYSSGDETIATVDNRTGRVTIANSITWGDAITYKDVTITASLAPSGCYQGKTATYTLRVNKLTCTEAAGTITASSEGSHVVIEGDEVKKCTGETVTLTLGGYEEGATSFQWYKDGVLQGDKTTASITTGDAGVWYAVSNKGCAVTSTNEITITNRSTSAHVTRLVKEWYIKHGRLTPDIALWELGDDCSFVSVAASDGWDAGTDLTGEGIFYEKDGIVYLKGTEPKTNAGAVQNYTLTLTVNDGCSNQTLDTDGKEITIHHQQNTDKHVLAFIVSGTDKGDWTAGVTADQTTNVGLYNAIAANFDVLATNSRSTDDEQKLKEYYSQFDILCITDYPNTGDKGANKKSYVDALGALVDIRPILTMEAWVSKLANWKAKGISGNPKNPSTRQYTMDLQCKDHEIFAGTERTKIGEGDEAMYRVSMVDNTKEDYATLDATYGDGAHADKSGYEYASKPALQGFTFTEDMADDLLPIGLIDDGAGNPLQVGIERQRNMEARLMVLGINSYAMERLTDDGEQVVINALNYLMKKNAEDIADCSIYFTGGDKDEDESTRYNWNVDSHWSNGTQPISTQKVRILAKCVIPSGVQVHVTDVLIVPDGPINHGVDVAKGSLTIEAGGALIVDGKVEATTAPNYFHPHATSAENLVLKTTSSAQAALIFDNEEAETQATVKLYSLGKKPSNYEYQYFAVPMEVVPVNPAFANETHGGTGIYTYVYDEASSGWTRRKYYDDLFAFEGLGITTKSTGAMNYTMTGNLASTATKEITLTHDGAGLNLIGNSWMAPIQIAALAEDNTDANITKTAYIYCAGRDAEGGAQIGDVSTEPAGQWIAIPFEASGTAGWRDAGKLSVIPAMQAFEINVSAEATLTLDYDKVVRGSTNDLNAKLRAPGRRMAANEVTMTNIRVADSKTHTDLSLFEGDSFSEAFDNGWEAEYMNGDGRSAKLYAETESGQMAVAAMYDYEGTVVGFAPGQETEYTFSFMGEDNGYYLNDIKLHNSVRISEGETYTFTYEEGDAANRFYISRTAINAPSVTTGMENLDAAAPRVQKIIYNDKLYIIRGGRLYDATGKVVK